MIQTVTMYKDSNGEVHASKAHAELADARAAVERFLNRKDFTANDARTIANYLVIEEFTMLVDDFRKKHRKVQTMLPKGG